MYRSSRSARPANQEQKPMTQRKLRYVALMILALLGVAGFSQVLRCKGSRKTLGTGADTLDAG